MKKRNKPENFRYAREKLSNTVRFMATAPGDTRTRLRKAYSEFQTLTSEHFPPSMKRKWNWIIHQMIRLGPVYHFRYQEDLERSAVENTMWRIKEKTAAKIAKEIFDLHCELHRKW